MKRVRVGLSVLLVFAVIAHGGVEEWARAIFEAGTAALFLYWAYCTYRRREQEVFVSPLLPPVLVFSVFVSLQWLFHLSVLPFATRLELQLLLAVCLYLFLAAQAFRTLEDWKTFVWFMMGFGFLVSLFGILQHLTFNGKLYWFRELHYGGYPFGPYVNRNHFAAFAELTIPIALVPLVLGKVRRERLFIVGLFVIVQIGALFLSASRGGIVSLACQLTALSLWLVFRRAGRAQLLAGAAVLVVALSLVYWLGAERIVRRFSTMQSLEISAGKRASMRRDTLRIFLEHPVIGTGLGTIEDVFPRYDTLYDGKVVNHAHNDYLEALAETGVIGALCCAWFLCEWLVGSYGGLFHAAESPFATSLRLSAFLACTGFLIHETVDFNLHIPANALLFFLMAFLSVVEIQAQPNGPERHHRRVRRRNP